MKKEVLENLKNASDKNITYIELTNNPTDFQKGLEQLVQNTAQDFLYDSDGKTIYAKINDDLLKLNIQHTEFKLTNFEIRFVDYQKK